jgi:lysozyme family protein
MGIKTMNKSDVINHIIDVEGGYVNDPSDSGGETMYGITVNEARRSGYTGEMHLLPYETAFDIYSRRYWDSVKADQMLQLSESVTAEVVDTGVNMGVTRASTFLQRVLNVFNKNGKLYDDLKVDGHIGAVTIRALNEYLARRDESVLVRALDSLQGAAYIELAERRQKDEKFVYGWLKNRVGI